MDDTSKVDRISNLPDNLIHCILSFNDMKYAVQTSVLSKRWKSVWKTLPFLNFDTYQFNICSQREFTVFVQFVYNVLLFRDGNSCIQRFQLDCREDTIGAFHIWIWINKAVAHNVEELCIKSDSSSGKISMFSDKTSLRTCKSLTKLDLDLGRGFSLGSEIAISNSVSLPRLKSLSLRFYDLSDDEEEFANELFTKCSALESLVLECDIDDQPINLNISIPSLKHFSLGSTDQLGLEKVITLCAPNLTSFTCSVDLLEDYCLESLSSLVTADVAADIRINIDQDDKLTEMELFPFKKALYARNMLLLLRGLQDAKVIKLTSDFQVLSGAPEVLNGRLLEFLNLQKLILTTWLSRGCKDAIVYLLEKSPQIEFLELNILVRFEAEDSWGPDLSLPFKLYTLRHIVIRGLRGFNNELEFIKIMLENAVALEEVVLFCRSNNNRVRRFKAKLLAETGASSSIISFKF